MAKPAKTEAQADDPQMPTPERLRQYGEQGDDFKTDTGRVIRRLNPIDALYTAYEISGEGYIAAGLFLHDWNLGGFAQRVTADMSRDIVDGGGSGDAFSAKRMDAAKRFTAAKHHVTETAGDRFTKALELMVLGDMSMTMFAREILHDPTKNAAKRGRYVLAQAINCLAGYYAPPMPEHTRKIHTWRPAEARPFIMGEPFEG